VRIEVATPRDREATIALWEAAGLTRPWNDPGSDFDLALATSTSDVLLARDGGDLVGSVMVGFDGHRGWVYYLATDPKRRKRGIGRALMTAAEAKLRELGCPRIRLMVRGGNLPARGFYEAVGYEVQDVITLGRSLT
jgi:ribosomal protein S18 acetylase RimI-like enzyme